MMCQRLNEVTLRNKQFNYLSLAQFYIISVMLQRGRLKSKNKNYFLPNFDMFKVVFSNSSGRQIKEQK